MKEKWMIMIRMEKKVRTDAERKAYEARVKKENRRLTEAKEQKKRMERAAMSAGVWDPKAMRNKQKEWSKKDEAVLVALHYVHGMPTDDGDWEVRPAVCWQLRG